MEATFTVEGTILTISTRHPPEPNCSYPDDGHIHITVDAQTLSPVELPSGPVRVRMTPSHARAVASAILSAATEAKP